MQIETEIRSLLQLEGPEALQRALALLAELGSEPVPEAWNSTFGPTSLFDAWTRTTIAGQVHEAVRQAIRPVIADPGFRVIEIGAGDGRVWRSLFKEEHRGELVVVDPMPEAIERVRSAVPPGVKFTPIVAPVQEASLPQADGLVCSLTLHHVAGKDAADRAAHGLQGSGKGEVLRAFATSLRSRNGIGVLAEADVDCDLDLSPGSAALAKNIFDAYIGRCAASIVRDVERDVPELLKNRWRALLQHWFLGQLAVIDAPLVERDVYELSVGRWLSLLDASGLEVFEHGPVDDVDLFHTYRFNSR